MSTRLKGLKQGYCHTVYICITDLLHTHTMNICQMLETCRRCPYVDHVKSWAVLGKIKPHTGTDNMR